MVYVQIDTVTDQMKKYQCRFFTVKDGTKTIDRYQDEDSTVDQSIAALEDFLHTLTGNFVDVTISDKSGMQQSRGGSAKMFEYRVKLGAVSQAISGTEHKGESLAGYKDLMKEIAQLREENTALRFQNTIDALKKEIQEIKNDKSNPLQEQALLMVANYLGGNGKTQPVQHLAGPPETADSKARLRAAIKKWMQLDPEMIETIEMIVQFAEVKPDSYNTTKTMLKAQL